MVMDFWHIVIDLGVLILGILSVYFLLTLKKFLGIKRNRVFNYALVGMVLAMSASFVMVYFSLPLEHSVYLDLHSIFIILGMLLFVAAIWDLYHHAHGINRLNFELLDKTRALEISNKMSEAIFSSIGEGVVVSDKHGRFIKINKQAEKLLGWKSEEVRGREVAALIPILDQNEQPVPLNKRPLFAAMKYKRRVSVMAPDSELILRRRDGSVFPLAATATPILMDGKIAGGIVVFFDISEEKAIDKAKSEFLSIASHQLKTPLTAINWYTEMLLKGDAGRLTKRQNEFVNQISAGAVRLVDLVNALLQVSRIETGHLKLSRSAVDVKKFIDACCREFEPDLRSKNLQLKIKYCRALPKIVLDQQLVQTALQNILLNAVKYTPAGGQISIECRRDGRWLLLVFKDTGYGIPKQQQAKVFTKMFRGSNIVLVEPAGTGLGLYIAKAIINKSGGDIWFESEEGKGTSFYIKLPLGRK